MAGGDSYIYVAGDYILVQIKRMELDPSRA